MAEELLNSAVFPFLFTGIALLLFDLWRARDTLARVVWITWLAAVALVSLFTFGYGVPDPAPYFLPAMALAVPAAASALTAIPRIGGRAGTTALTAAGFLALALVVPWLRDANEERLATLSYDRVIHSMWSSIPPDTAVVSWTDDRFSRLVEYQRLRGEKPALVVVTPDLLFAPRIRQAFAQRFGVDPIEGFQPPRLSSRLSLAEQKSIIDDSRQRLVQSLNERLRVPVIVFDPSVPTVWQLDKPGRSAVPDGPVLGVPYFFSPPIDGSWHWMHSSRVGSCVSRATSSLECGRWHPTQVSGSLVRGSVTPSTLWKCLLMSP